MIAYERNESPINASSLSCMQTSVLKFCLHSVTSQSDDATGCVRFLHSFSENSSLQSFLKFHPGPKNSASNGADWNVEYLMNLFVIQSIELFEDQRLTIDLRDLKECIPHRLNLFLTFQRVRGCRFGFDHRLMMV